MLQNETISTYYKYFLIEIKPDAINDLMKKLDWFTYIQRYIPATYY